jgi:hypothetical protein
MTLVKMHECLSLFQHGRRGQNGGHGTSTQKTPKEQVTNVDTIFVTPKEMEEVDFFNKKLKNLFIFSGVMVTPVIPALRKLRKIDL